MKKGRFLSAVIVTVTILLLLTAGTTMYLSPSARGYSQMAYDPSSGQIVLYGGQTGYWLDPAQQNHETWLYDPEGNVWKQMNPINTPGGCCGGDMVYNSKADRSILSVFTDDWSALQTWAYDANSDTWTQLADGPYIMVG